MAPLAVIKVDSDSNLLCPACEHAYMHLRAAEPSRYATGAVAAARDECYHCSRTPDVDAELIFVCEGCKSKAIMKFVQHKGNTLVSWIPDVGW